MYPTGIQRPRRVRPVGILQRCLVGYWKKTREMVYYKSMIDMINNKLLQTARYNPNND